MRLVLVLLGLSSSALAAPLANNHDSSDPTCWDIGQPCWQAESAGRALADSLRARSPADMGSHDDAAILTARGALGALADAVSLGQRDPGTYLSDLAAAPATVAKRDPAPWCAMPNAHSIGGHSIKMCWKRSIDGADGHPHDKAKRDLAERRQCLEADGECAIVRRAALAVLEAIDKRDAKPEAAAPPAPIKWSSKRDLDPRATGLWFSDGRAAPNPWCQWRWASCWKVRRDETAVAPASPIKRDDISAPWSLLGRATGLWFSDGRAAPNPWCQWRWSSCWKRDESSALSSSSSSHPKRAEAPAAASPSLLQRATGLWFSDGRAAPNPWCQWRWSSCWKRDESSALADGKHARQRHHIDEMSKVARDILDGLRID